MTSDAFPANFMTTGWSRIHGRWVECGHSRGVESTDVSPPELGIHDVAGKLNELEEHRKEIMNIVQKLAAGIVAEYPEITEEWRRTQLRAQIEQAFRFANDPDHTLNTGDSAAWLAAHPDV